MQAPVFIPLKRAVADTRAALVLAEKIPSEAARRQVMHYPLARLEEAKAADPTNPAVRNAQSQVSQALTASQSAATESASAPSAPAMASAAVDGRGGNVDAYA